MGFFARKKRTMIVVTRFDHSELVVNADLIEFVEALPDTHVTLVTGKKLLVREKREEVVARVLDWRRQVGSTLSRPPSHEVLAAAHAAEEE